MKFSYPQLRALVMRGMKRNRYQTGAASVLRSAVLTGSALTFRSVEA